MFTFDPSAIAWTLPFLELPVTWYGMSFASGLMIASLTASYHLKNFYRDAPAASIQPFVDSATLYATVFLLLGARLAEALFYSPHLLRSPLDFISVWEGGLASHGGILGLAIGCLFFYGRHRKHELFIKHQLNPLRAADIVSLSGLICGVFIRLGNFMNQEIVGKASDLPWAILFKHPREMVEAIPRHPSQLYEALGYLLLWLVQTRRFTTKKTPGVIMSETLLGIFIVRWLVEYSKSPVIASDAYQLLTTGQLLSVPFLFAAWGIRAYLLRNAH